MSPEEVNRASRLKTAQHRWKGIHKLTEECGEVLQLIGKINVFPDGDHPDGAGPLKRRIGDELDDLEAAITYFREQIGVDRNIERMNAKLTKFRDWGLSGVL